MSEIKKILLAGDGGVGRSTLLHRYIEGEFNPDTQMTIAFSFSTKEVQVEDRQIKFLFFDLAGQSRFREIQEPYIGNAHGAILAFDLTRPLTLENIEEWVSFLRSSNQNLPILLVGLKADLWEHINIDDAYLLHKIDSLSLIGYIKASCKTGFNVNLVFEVLARNILDLPELPQPYPDPLEEIQFTRQNLGLNRLSHLRFVNPNQIEITQLQIQTLTTKIHEEIEYVLPKTMEIKKKDIGTLIEKIISTALTYSNLKLKFFKLLFLKEYKSIQKIITTLFTNNPVSRNDFEDAVEKIREILTPLVNTFIINNRLSLKYENGESHIYVDNQRFYQCKYLLLNIDINEIERYENIESIDEAADYLNHSMELSSQNSEIIDSRTEFWGHCSNLQAWYENNYDTRILHRNLAFPLLRKLAEAGDARAKIAFKEEIARRFESGYPNVILYLLEDGFLRYLNKIELDALELYDIEYQNIIFWEKIATLYYSQGLIDKAKLAVDKILLINPSYKLSNKKLSQIKLSY